MRRPTIHVNGTARATLAEQQESVGHAARALLSALSDAAPNARDYYLQGEGAYGEARAEHEARERAVRAVLADATDLHETILDQGEG